ncbi:MAG: tRNA dihydrouridine synthase DusB [Clostridia bacterium]|nr:tRNA dihydrouridine synthase DusB [Clostridia bacterium]
MRIGTIDIPQGAALAPMAGISDVNMRLLCHEQGSAYAVSEMLSAKGYVYAPDRPVHKELLRYSEGEGICALQLFGSEEEMLTRAIKMLNGSRFSFFDFNMGCPAHKIVANGEGSALMLEPVKAGHLISAMVKASEKPVTVKIRAGWDREHCNAVEIARIAEDAGASAIAVHPRTRDMFYAGKADWDIISAVKQSVRIPVIGNGDIFSAADALKMLAQTGCDAVMVARGAQGNIWIFQEILCALEKRPYSPPGYEERIRTLLRHLDMQVESLGESIGVMEMRKHIAWYLQGMPGSGRLRAGVNQMTGVMQVRDALYRYMESLEGSNLHGTL